MSDLRGIEYVARKRRDVSDDGRFQYGRGVGGISDANDVAEYMMAGANAVQIGTALGGRDPVEYFGELESSFMRILYERGLDKASDITNWRSSE